MSAAARSAGSFTPGSLSNHAEVRAVDEDLDRLLVQHAQRLLAPERTVPRVLGIDAGLQVVKAVGEFGRVCLAGAGRQTVFHGLVRELRLEPLALLPGIPAV